VISGRRYAKITDEVIKYALGYYGAPVVPVDKDVMDRIMNYPRTKELLDWKPEGYFKTVEEFRGELGPELTDDDLLLKILIPGRALVKNRAQEESAAPTAGEPGKITTDGFPTMFQVEVDGDVFHVRISPVWNGNEGGGLSVEAVSGGDLSGEAKREAVPPGAVLSGMSGLVLTIEVKIGDRVAEGETVAMIEAMKMRRPLGSPHGGVVQEVCVKVGDVVNPHDILMVVAPND
jgi:biotin carboxyl carrier protein